MKRWQYGYADYDGSTLSPHPEMPDMSGPGGVQPFLKEAGEKGWELCGAIPSVAANRPVPAGPADLMLIFKRPLQ